MIRTSYHFAIIIKWCWQPGPIPCTCTSVTQGYPLQQPCIWWGCGVDCVLLLKLLMSCTAVVVNVIDKELILIIAIQTLTVFLSHWV